MSVSLLLNIMLSWQVLLFVVICCACMLGYLNECQL